MSLFERAGFEDHVARLPAVSMHEQWGSLVAKVGGKVFALMGLGGATGAVVFKVSELSFEALTGMEGVTQAPYFAKRGWVSVAPGALPEEEVARYLVRAHLDVAGKLTRKAQAEFGLASYLAETPESGSTA